MIKKYIDIVRAKSLQKSIGFFTPYENETPIEDLVLTNTSNLHDVHKDNEEFKTAVKQYAESMKKILKILEVE